MDAKEIAELNEQLEKELAAFGKQIEGKYDPRDSAPSVIAAMKSAGMHCFRQGWKTLELTLARREEAKQKGNEPKKT